MFPMSVEFVESEDYIQELQETVERYSTPFQLQTLNKAISLQTWAHCSTAVSSSVTKQKNYVLDVTGAL